MDAIPLRSMARPHLRVRHERQTMAGVPAVRNNELENGNGVLLQSIMENVEWIQRMNMGMNIGTLHNV